LERRYSSFGKNRFNLNFKLLFTVSDSSESTDFEAMRLLLTLLLVGSTFFLFSNAVTPVVKCLFVVEEGRFKLDENGIEQREVETRDDLSFLKFDFHRNQRGIAIGRSAVVFPEGVPRSAKAWIDTGMNTLFVKFGTTRWKEFHAGKEFAKFREVEQKQIPWEEVLLHDENRNIWVRLRPWEARWHRSGAKPVEDGNFLVSGGFVT